MRLITPLFLLVLASLNLFLVLHARYRVAALEGMLVLDAARASVSISRVLHDPEEISLKTRELAFKDALRSLFGWGRFRESDFQFQAQNQFWGEVSVDPACSALMGRDLTIKKVFWGSNYAKVRFEEIEEWIQVNFWSMVAGPAQPQNPGGWVFEAHLSLVEDAGVSL